MLVKGDIDIGVRIILPQFDAHSLKGTIVPEEREDDKKNTQDV